MSRVSVKNDILLWALARANLSVEEVEKKFPHIGKWLQGEINPTLHQIEVFSKTTRTPIGIFFLEEPPKDILPIPFFRTVESHRSEPPSVDLLDTIQSMQRRQLWKHEYLAEKGIEGLPYVGSVNLKNNPKDVAKKMRLVLGLEERWATDYPTWIDALKALRQAMESAGIIVVINGVVGNNTNRKLQPSEFRGFVLVDKLAPLVFANGADGRAAQMFTLAHEMAHILYGSSAAFDLRDMLPAINDTEIACNRAAAEFLVSEDYLRIYWNQIREEEDPFQKIARHFKVSKIVAARRALDLSLIDKDRFISFYRDWSASDYLKAKKRAGGGNFKYNQNYRIGKEFFRTVLQAAREGNLLYSEAFNLTDLSGRTFDNYAKYVEGENQ